MPPKRAPSIGRFLGPLPAAPGGPVEAVCSEIRREFGLLPEPLSLHAAAPGLIAPAWAILRETVVVGGRLGRPVKEAMAVAVSVGNRCPYCVDAHGIALHALGDGAAEAAIRKGRRGRLDPRFEALTAWAAASRRADDPRLAAPPFGPEETAEAVGTVLCFHYINRMATVLLAETLLPRWLRRPLLPVIGRRLRKFARAPLTPGESLRLLAPAAPASGRGLERDGAAPVSGPDLDWAAASPPIAAAFAAMGEATAAAVRPVLSPAAQARVLDHLAGWRGEDPPFGFSWLEGTIAGLDEPEAAAVRLALLTALVPHRVDEPEVAAFRRHFPGDTALVATLAWACFETARRISRWIAPAS